MDKQLAEIFGTAQPEAVETDMHKIAAAELLVKLSEERGVDLSQFSDAEVAEMVGQLYSGETKVAEADPTVDDVLADVSGGVANQEKIAEARFLGKVMAHSMVQELNNIEKQAGEVPPQFLKKDEKKEEAGKKDEKKEEEGEKKEAGALEQLAEQRAFELAKEAGYVDAEGRLLVPVGAEKQASAVQQAIDTRALQILESHGLPVQWNK